MCERVQEQTVTTLVAAAAGGDRTAWAEIIRRYGDLVRATVAGYRMQQANGSAPSASPSGSAAG